jgi:hypothetical protein
MSVDVNELIYKSNVYTFNPASNRYECNIDGSYIDLAYKVYDANGNQIGQYYPPLAAAPNISWVIPAILITVGFIYLFRKELSKYIK